MDLADKQATEDLFKEKFHSVVHLAAQPGVRYSIKNPHVYIQDNIVAFINILEGCRHHQINHLVYASSSSVYGSNTKLPFSEEDNVDHPVSLYAATKKSNELMAHTYSHLFGLSTTGLRFFTVYGPWGRPDMSPSLFARAILEGKEISVFNEGNMQRDFTYVDDIVEGVIRVLEKPAEPSKQFDPLSPNPAMSTAPYRLYNIGNHEPVGLSIYIQTLENELGKKAAKRLMPMQPGDVQTTYADIESLHQAVGFYPSTPLAQGIAKFAEWFKPYYGFA
jgi:UDP-glucuronate 4-epimerase